MTAFVNNSGSYKNVTSTGSVTTSPTPFDASTLPDEILATLDTPPERRTPTEVLALARHVTRFADDKGKELFKQIGRAHV